VPDVLAILDYLGDSVSFYTYLAKRGNHTIYLISSTVPKT